MNLCMSFGMWVVVMNCACGGPVMISCVSFGMC